MLIVKFIGGILVIMCGTMCGVYVSRIAVKRVKFWEEYLFFLTSTKVRIAYAAVPAAELLIGEDIRPMLCPILRGAAEQLKAGIPFDRAWRQAFERKNTGLMLNRCDREKINAFGNGFGTGDVDGEVQKLELHISLIRDHLDKLKADLDAKRRISRIVGMFVGVVVTVLII